MKKRVLISIVSYLLLFTNVNSSQTEQERNKYLTEKEIMQKVYLKEYARKKPRLEFEYIGKTPPNTFGKPFKVLYIEDKEKAPTKDYRDKDERYKYQYKMVLRRPSKDNFSGVAEIAGVKLRLYYWAAEVSDDPYTVIMYGGEEHKISQRLHKPLLNDFYRTFDDYTKVEIHFDGGLKPGKHKIRVVIFPYPMITDTISYKDVLKYYPEEAINIIEAFLKNSNPVSMATYYVYNKLNDIRKEKALREYAFKFGRVVSFEVPARMPNIRGVRAKKAAKILKSHSLTPNPDYKNFIQTNNKKLDGKVARVQYTKNRKLKARTKVAYKFYKYTQPLQASNVKHCYSKNPSQRSSIYLDTNNKPKDKTYLKCDYYDSGNLRYETPYKDGLKHGIQYEYRENGRVYSQTPYVEGKIHGIEYRYFENNRVKDEIPYKSGKKHGTEKEYLITKGKYFLRATHSYKEGKQHGKSYLYWSTGKKQSEMIYKNGKRVKRYDFRSDGSIM